MPTKSRLLAVVPTAAAALRGREMAISRLSAAVARMWMRVARLSAGIARLRTDDLPTTTPSGTNPVPNPTQGQWYSVDITALYNGWQNGTYSNYGVQFRPVNHGNNNFNEFYSADYADDLSLRPKLVITK